MKKLRWSQTAKRKARMTVMERVRGGGGSSNKRWEGVNSIGLLVAWATRERA